MGSFEGPPAGVPFSADEAWSRFRATRGRRLDRVPVAEVMSAPALTVRLDDTLWYVLERFVMEDLRHLVVVDDAGRCAGIVSNRGLSVSWPPDPVVLRLRRVEEVVGPAVTVPAASSVVEAAWVMWCHRLDALPVVADDTTVLGIVTGTDLVGLMAARGRADAGPLPREDGEV